MERVARSVPPAARPSSPSTTMAAQRGDVTFRLRPHVAKGADVAADARGEVDEGVDMGDISKR